MKDLLDDPVNVRHRDAPTGELEESIAHYGVIEPLVVRPKGAKFAVVIGSRRFHAARAVGLRVIPAIVKELSDEEAFIESAVENIQRESLDPNDELDVVARAYEIFDEDTTKVARAFDRSRKWVEDRLLVQRSYNPSKGGRGSQRVEIPRDISKIANIARAAEAVYDTAPSKRKDLFDELKDRPREQVERTVRRLREVAKSEPERVATVPVRDVIREVMEQERLELSLPFPTILSRGIQRAARSRKVSEEDIVYIAVEDWLKRQHFL